MCEFCDKMKKQTGYRGQKYAVYYTRDGEESLMGWQNEPSGGLEDVAKIMPGVTSTRVAPVHSQPPRAGLASLCSGDSPRPPFPQIRTVNPESFAAPSNACR